MLNIRDRQKGEIVTTLALIGLGVLILGIVAGGKIVQNRSRSQDIRSKASSSGLSYICRLVYPPDLASCQSATFDNFQGGSSASFCTDHDETNNCSSTVLEGGETFYGREVCKSCGSQVCVDVPNMESKCASISTPTPPPYSSCNDCHAGCVGENCVIGGVTGICAGIGANNCACKAPLSVSRSCTGLVNCNGYGAVSGCMEGCTRTWCSEAGALACCDMPAVTNTPTPQLPTAIPTVPVIQPPGPGALYCRYPCSSGCIDCKWADAGDPIPQGYPNYCPDVKCGSGDICVPGSCPSSTYGAMGCPGADPLILEITKTSVKIRSANGNNAGNKPVLLYRELGSPVWLEKRDPINEEGYQYRFELNGLKSGTQYKYLIKVSACGCDPDKKYCGKIGSSWDDPNKVTPYSFVTYRDLACYPQNLYMSTEPNIVAPGGSIKFVLNNTDGGTGSTFGGANLGGGANCTGGMNWSAGTYHAEMTCTASTTPNTYTWTQSWRECQGDFEHCYPAAPNYCTKSLDYRVVSAITPTPTPTSTPLDSVQPNVGTCSGTYDIATNEIKFSWGWNSDQTCAGCEPAVGYCTAANICSRPAPPDTFACNQYTDGPFWWQIYKGFDSPSFAHYSGVNRINIPTTYPPGGTSYKFSCDSYSGDTFRLDLITRDARGNARYEPWDEVCSASATCPSSSPITPTPIPTGVMVYCKSATTNPAGSVVDKNPVTYDVISYTSGWTPKDWYVYGTTSSPPSTGYTKCLVDGDPCTITADATQGGYLHFNTNINKDDLGDGFRYSCKWNGDWVRWKGLTLDCGPEPGTKCAPNPQSQCNNDCEQSVAIVTPTITPTPTVTATPVPGAPHLKLKVRLPDISSSVNSIPLGKTQVYVYDGTSLVATANVALTRAGTTDYFTTNDYFALNVSTTKQYTIGVKNMVTIRRLFTGVTLIVNGNPLDCTMDSNAACGQLITERDNKLLLSGDSDGFDTTSGSYNIIDVLDLQRWIANYPSADFNLSGSVNISDLDKLAKNFNQSGD